MNRPLKFELGAKVKDSITGFSGTVTGRVEYLTGCAQYVIQPPLNAKGDFVDGRWMDEDRLVVLDEPKHEIDVQRAGPDYPAPIK